MQFVSVDYGQIFVFLDSNCKVLFLNSKPNMYEFRNRILGLKTSFLAYK